MFAHPSNLTQVFLSPYSNGHMKFAASVRDSNRRNMLHPAACVRACVHFDDLDDLGMDVILLVSAYAAYSWLHIYISRCRHPVALIDATAADPPA
ncbi:uncharacterized protein LY89DRAFT_496159 [Mollisia scopiformis]|uniref:Uncharacterized protein n=1 Tax=Mollisia scopiformis TaxID=149040 RepID=A0A194XHJ0_MOLSC|nr:uncharacterized protein LY89DRAFT_496159 [Mollisia scopiformis]KUJ19601.1 hypothetical protein LY89DRAFT_496159 [Mollisia scopiformis]